MKYLARVLLVMFIPFVVGRETVSVSAASIVSLRSGNWNAASTWSSGAIPQTGDTVTIQSGHIVIANINSTVAGMTVNGELRYAPSASVTLSSTANVIVNGKLTMKPASATIIHTLRFTGINEANFVGGGMAPLATDVGLWVMGAGKLDILGSVKTAWARANDIGTLINTITFPVAPVGWRVGDEIALTPTQAPTIGNGSWNGFELRTIAAINGATITLSAITQRKHPINIDPANGVVYGPEVLNLTRNVRIEGTGDGEPSPATNHRAHIFVRSTVPQSIRYASLRYLGPRQPDGQDTRSVLGRYGLHFHMSGAGSVGSLVEGVVVRDAGAHAFVPHASNGITFKDTISYNTFDEAYWWDDPEDGDAHPDINDSSDILFDRAVAALVRVDPASGGQSLAGFVLRQGEDNSNAIRNSVAVGIQGKTDASGFEWPEHGDSLWVFTDNVAHNNKADGLFVWHNDIIPHTVTRAVSYNNTGSGIDHGAYGNAYQYMSPHTWGNGEADFKSRASSHKILRPDGYGQALEGLYAPGTFLIAEHNMPYVAPTLVMSSTIGRITVSEAAKPVPGQYDFVNCTRPGGASLQPSDFSFVFAYPTSRYRVQNGASAWQVMGDGTVTTIAPFYN